MKRPPKPVSIELSDIGPVEEFSFTMRAPGLYCLHGKQGSGKTTILRTAQLVVDGPAAVDARPTKRDGAKRGEATIAGKTLRIVQKIRSEGDIGVEGLGDLSITDLHTPKYDKAVTRDRHRITTLVRIASVQADATLFHGLLGGREKFESLIPHDSLTTPDLVEMAARVKRAIEREAALVEDRAKTLRAEARAHSSIAEATDLTLPSDAELLQDGLEDALLEAAQEKVNYEQLIASSLLVNEKLKYASEARAKLESFKAGPTVAECIVKVAAAEKLQETWDVEVRRLADELDEATRHANRCAELTHQARTAYAQAEREAELYEALHQAVDAGAVAEVSQVDIDDQREAVEITAEDVRKARSALELGVRVRDALVSQQRAESTNHAAAKLEVEAVRLRDAAADTATVLTNAIATIPNCPLRVRFNDTGDPVLVCATDRSDTEPFEELSDGEKWITVVQIAAAGNRLIVLPQAAFGELSDSSRDMLDGLARANDCYILTALAEDCELRAEPWRK